MKNLVICLFIMVSLTLSGQENIEKKIGEFSTVKVYDLINLKMIKSNENKVVISGKNRRDIEIVNKNGKLKIRMNVREVYDGNNTVVSLYYTSVDVIDANEGAEVTVNDPIKQFEIELKSQEGAEITAEINTNYANFRAVTGGIINVTGSSKNQDISIYTGGIYNGKECITNYTEVSVNAAGEAYVNAKESIDARIRAGGNIYIYGNPKMIDESRVFGGRIKRM